MEFDIKFTADGLIPVIVQEASGTERPSGRVLMFAWMNRESLAMTLEKGLMTYWSRSRSKLWWKPLGDTIDEEGLRALIRKRLDHGTMQRVT